MEKPTARSSKEKDEKARDHKLEEQINKSLGNGTPEEKLEILLKKCMESEKENKKLNTKVKHTEKNLEVILREKDTLQKEYNKGVLIKDKLEQVCREQQKLIKSVKNENLTKIREEEERRKESQAKFQHSINEINITLNKNNDENMKLRDDNIEMTKKLKYLAEQYHAREQQLEKINEQISIESQLHAAKLTKAQMEAAIEKESLLRDKQKGLDELLNCKKVIQEMQKHESQLKEQVNLYTTKYDDFHSSLQKSNKIFASYKEELEKMAKYTKKLEKENNDLHRKFERSNATLIDLSTEKQAKDEYVAKCTKQVQQLQKLLRTLQAERTQLHTLLKENNIERPPMPILPNEPELAQLPPLPAETLQKDRMEVMQKNCSELKQTLAKLQGQMNAITAKQVEGDQKPLSKVSSTERDVSSSTISAKKNKNKNKKNKNKTVNAVNANNNLSPELEQSSTSNSTVNAVNTDNNLSLEIEQSSTSNSTVNAVNTDNNLSPDLEQCSSSSTSNIKEISNSDQSNDCQSIDVVVKSNSDENLAPQTECINEICEIKTVDTNEVVKSDENGLDEKINDVQTTSMCSADEFVIINTPSEIIVQEIVAQLKTLEMD